MTKAITREKLAELMGEEEVVFNRDLMLKLIAGNEAKQLDSPDVELLESAGYITIDREVNQYIITSEAWEVLNGVLEWDEHRERMLEAKMKRDAEERKVGTEEWRVERQLSAKRLADSFLAQGLLVIEGGCYKNTLAGWKRAQTWLRYLMQASISLDANCGDYEGVKVGSEADADARTVPAEEWKRSRKRILGSLSEDERRLWGLQPSKPLNKKCAVLKNRITQILTSGQEFDTAEGWF